MKNRLDKLRRLMQSRGLDAALITSGVNVRYYTGFTSWECEVLLTEAACYLVTDFRYTIQAKAQVNGCAEVIERNGKAEQLAMVRQLLTENGCKTCGFEEENLTVGQFKDYAEMPVRWEPFGEPMSNERIVKSPAEVASLQKAQKLADAAFLTLVSELRLGMTEAETAARLNYLCSIGGSEGPAFDPIVGSGPNGAMCHAVPGERKFQKGDLVVFDFGCMADGYRSDMTRTVAFGPLDDELRKIYDITLEAQLRTLAAVKSGITGTALDAVARDYITAKGYGDNFGHGLGHGFGLEIHEPPRASRNCPNVLTTGMTITVEPGIYLEGKGGVRIEDCVVVTDGGCLNLVSTAKDLLILS